MLTAIVPTYNQGETLLRAVDALAAQVPCPDEILVIDDASTDETPTVLAEVARRYPLVRGIRHERNLGAVRSLNRGLAEARGRYVYLGAADDQALPGLFARGLDLLKAHPEAAFACAEWRTVDKTGVDRGIRPLSRPTMHPGYVPASSVPSLLRRIDDWAHTSTAVLKRDLVEAAGGLDPALGSFADGFLLRSLALRYGFCFTPHLVALWTANPDGLSRSTIGDPGSMLQLLEAARRRFAGESAFPQWYPDLFERRLRFATVRIALDSGSRRREAVEAAAAATAFDRAFLRAALAVPGKTGRSLVLGWVVLRKRPISLIALARTALARRLGGSWQ